MINENGSILSNKEENNNDSETLNITDDLDENCDIEKLKEINIKSVDLIFEEKPQKSLDILKKLESFLENKIIDMKTKISKKFIIIILHNIACCYQKLKDYDNCINYLEAVIYHFDKLIEEKHKIVINEEYFDSLIKNKNCNYEKKLLGDLILELRFCAKFHLQMGVIFSEAKRHVDSLKHIKLASLICEDNILKTTYLYNQLKESFLQNKKNKNEKEDSELANIKQQIKTNYKIIMELNKRIENLRNNNILKNKINNFDSYNNNCKKNMKSIYNNNYMYIKNVITKIVKNTSNKSKVDFVHNYFDSYLAYRDNEISNYNQNISDINDIKGIFESKFIQKDDWIKLLNIENIMFLSALNYDDLDLESDPKYELLRDSILEKVIMLTVSYYCLSNELRYLSKDKNNNNINGEYYLHNAVNLSLIFLPVSCSIVSYYINSYYKNYGQGMDIIPEGEIIDYKTNIIKKEIDENDEEGDEKNKKKENFQQNDYIYFIKGQKINRIIKENNNCHSIYNNDELTKSKSKSKSNKKDYYLSEYSDNNYTLKKRNNLEEEKDDKDKLKKLSNNKIIHSANTKLKGKELQIINISDTNILNKNNIFSKENNTSKVSNSPSSSGVTDSEKKNDNYINITNGNFGLIPNNNFIERVNKSKISENKAPKFKLNFNNINLNNDFYDTNNINNNSGSVTCHAHTHIFNQISADKISKNEKEKQLITTSKKNQISKINITNKFSNKTSINIQLNHNCKTNTNINININNLERKKNTIKSFNKINIKNLGYKTERLHLKGNNVTNTQKKIIYKKNEKSKNTSKKYIKNKKTSNSIYEEKLNNINTMSQISKYFFVKGVNFLEKENLTDRYIVKINNKLKGKKIKMNKNITHNSNSPLGRREINNKIYNNYIKKKKKEKNPIKLVQNNKGETGKYSVLSDNQKNNISNGNSSNVRNFHSNDSNIEDFSLGSKKISKLKGQLHQVENINVNKKEKERINKYFKNINLIKKLINNNKNNLSEKAFNKQTKENNQIKFYQALKKMNILPDNKTKICTVKVQDPKPNNIQKNK